MTKEELHTLVSLYPVISKERLHDTLSKEDLILLCECFYEEVQKWKEYTGSARNQLDLLLGTKKASDEFQRIIGDLV